VLPTSSTSSSRPIRRSDIIGAVRKSYAKISLVKLQDEISVLLKERAEQKKFLNRLKRLPERLKNRMSNARYLPQIDSVYVYNETRLLPFHHRPEPDAGYRYKNRNVLLKSKQGEIHIYHQSIEINGVIKGITIVSLDDNEKRVKKLLESVKKTVSEDPARLAVYNTAFKPVQLDILHLY